MEAQKKIDTKDLDHKIASLKKNLAFLNEGTEVTTLPQIVHRAGWTTIIQVALAAQILDAMNQQAAALNGLKDTLQKHVEASGAA